MEANESIFEAARDTERHKKKSESRNAKAAVHRPKIMSVVILDLRK